MKIIKSYGMVFVFLFTAFSINANSDNELPKEFQGDKWNSKYEISYDDLSALLNATVLDMGLSSKNKLTYGPIIWGRSITNLFYRRTPNTRAL